MSVLVVLLYVALAFGGLVFLAWLESRRREQAPSDRDESKGAGSEKKAP